MREFLADVIFPAAVFVFLGACVFGAIAGGVDLLLARSCRIYMEETGRPTRYRHFDSCYVYAFDEWMNVTEYYERVKALEGLRGQ
jgi:hypothetical protein